MELEPIIAQLRAQCPTFAGRIAGAAEYSVIQPSTSLAVPYAFVIPLDDNPDPSQSENSVSQSLDEGFAVIVALSNVANERGQAAARSVHLIRAEVWRALLGWMPAPQYGPISYSGGTLQALDRARLWYQFEFLSNFHIGPEDGWQAQYINSLPALQGVDVQVDVIDPIADPNVAYPGPDGRIEQTAQINFS